MNQIKKWNVIFLVNQKPPSKIVMLKRATYKSFAPGFYTGIGGKIGDIPGLENETELESAYRELREETEGELSEKNTDLTEFARCVYENGLRLYYYWGYYKKPTPPYILPEDGTLEWVPVNQIFKKDIIPTTLAVCKEWDRQSFALNKPFTIHVKEIGKKDTVRLVKTVQVEEGLN